MNKHRSSQDRVPNRHQLDNFDPADTIESLHAAILRVETIARIASDAMDQFRCPPARSARRAFARMQILVGNAANEATAALAESDRAVSDLSRYLEHRSDE